MRKKATAYEIELRNAARDLGRDKDDWSVQRLANLTLLWKVAQHRWTTNQSAANTDQVVSLMDAIDALRKEVKPAEGVQFNVQYVESYVGLADVVCPHCGLKSRHEISREPFKDDAARVAKPAAPPSTEVRESPAESAEKSRSDDRVVPLVHVREGVSVSNFHAQQLASGETPPLRHHHQGGQSYVR
jgi:hypothetical protein